MTHIRKAWAWVIREMHALGRERESGAHRLRASFAERFMIGQIDKGKTEREGRRALSRALGHRRIDVTYHYVPRGWEGENASVLAYAIVARYGASNLGAAARPATPNANVS